MESSTTHERNWADLPPELLGLILKYVLLPDYIRLEAVCKGWRSAARDNHQERVRICYQKPPMLLLLTNGARGRMLSLWEGKFYNYPSFTIYHRPFGSSYGWLAVAVGDGKDWSIRLLNSFSQKVIRLASITIESDDYFRVKTVALSCDPCSNQNEWVALAIYGWKYRLAFIKAGHNSWYYVKNHHVIAAGFYEGQLYFIDLSYELFRIAIQDKEQDRQVKRLTKITSCFPISVSSEFYFVELEGDLVIVHRRFKAGRVRTVGFDLCKLCLKEEKYSMVEMHDMKGFSLFVGENKPICISMTTFSDCRPNCIYFMPVNGYKDDMGVFDLATGDISRYHKLQMPTPIPRAMWISPTLVQNLFN